MSRDPLALGLVLPIFSHGESAIVWSAVEKRPDEVGDLGRRSGRFVEVAGRRRDRSVSELTLDDVEARAGL